MAYIDPWGGYAEGMQHLTATLKDMSEQDQKRRLQQLQEQELGLKIAAEKRKAEAEARTLADTEEQRAALREASKPVSVTTQTENPAWTEYQKTLAAASVGPPEFRVYSPTGLADLTSGLRSEPSPPAGRAELFRETAPGAAKVDLTSALRGGAALPPPGGVEALKAGMGVSPLDKSFVPSGAPEEKAVQGEYVYPGQDISTYPAPEKMLSQTTSQTPHPLRAQIEAGKILMAKGNPLGQSMLQAAQKSIHDEMATLVSVGDVDSAAKLYSDISGTTVTPLGKNDRYEFLKTDQGVVAIDRHKLRQTGDLNSSWQLLEGTGKAEKEPTTAQADFIQGRAAQLMATGMDKASAKLQAAKEYIALEQQGKKDLKTTVVVQPSQHRDPNLPPGYSYDKQGNYYRLDPVTGKSRPVTPQEAQDLLSTAMGFQQERSAARTAGGVRSMVAQGAYDQFTSDAKTLQDMAAKVDRKLIVSAIPVLQNSTDLRKAETVLRKKFNDPLAAAYFSKALATAEALGNALGGQGATSDFKLKIARDLIDYGYDPDTMRAVIDAHAGSLLAKAKSYKQWGNAAPPSGAGKSDPLGIR